MNFQLTRNDDEKTVEKPYFSFLALHQETGLCITIHVTDHYQISYTVDGIRHETLIERTLSTGIGQKVYLCKNKHHVIVVNDLPKCSITVVTASRLLSKVQLAQYGCPVWLDPESYDPDFLSKLPSSMTLVIDNPDRVLEKLNQQDESSHAKV